MLKYILCILLIVIVFSGTDLYVGYAGKNNNFNTVQEAVNKAASIGPKDESTRVTIHIAPGTYRQQVMVQTPYITFVNDEPSKGEVLLTWYYGIGYKYYSANDNGVYDANAAKAKSAKRPAKQRWGATVLLTNKASNFKAKDITFENSFNRYMTNEELADGVEVLGDSNTSPINVQRTSSLDVKSKAATEEEQL
jgi:pectin methylesterase-like acyl-CoA thioesterase